MSTTDIDLKEVIEIYNYALDKSLDEADRLRTKITEIKQRLAFQQAVNAKLSERLLAEKERDQKIQKEIQDV